MKAFYIGGNVRLTDDLREKFRGHRVENADAFGVVAQGITEAEVIGDYPDIVQALKDAGVDVSVSTGKPRGRPPKAKTEPETQPEAPDDKAPD